MSKAGWKFSQNWHGLVWSNDKYKTVIDRHVRRSCGPTRMATVNYSIWTGRKRVFYETLRDAIRAAEEMG